MQNKPRKSKLKVTEKLVSTQGKKCPAPTTSHYYVNAKSERPRPLTEHQSGGEAGTAASLLLTRPVAEEGVDAWQRCREEWWGDEKPLQVLNSFRVPTSSGQDQ